MFKRRPSWIPLLSLLVLLGTSPASRADEPDVVVLTGGNRISGQVRELSRGHLAFRIAGIGTVDINWGSVESLQTAQMLDIELTDGTRLSGSISTTADGTLEVMTTSGPRIVERHSVIRMTRVGASVRARTSGAFDLGLDFYTAGGHEVDWMFNGEIQNRTDTWLTEAAINSTIRQTSGETARDRTRFTADGRRFLQERWFVIGLFEGENDQALDLDSRFLFGLAGGRTLIQTNRNVLAFYAGFDYQRENYVGVPGTYSNPEALGSVEWDVFEIGGDTELDTKATTYIGLNRSRARLMLDASLRRRLTGPVYWSLNLFEEYDSSPPNDTPRSDFGLSITIGYELPRL